MPHTSKTSTAATTSQTHKTPASSPLHTYHSDVMQAMSSQMVHHRHRPMPDNSAPLPLAKKPVVKSQLPTSSASSAKQPALTQHVNEEMARRVKAERVLQDLRSDKSRQQVRARETARRNKWAKTIASTVPPPAGNVPVMKSKIAQLDTKRRIPQAVQ